MDDRDLPRSLRMEEKNARRFEPGGRSNSGHMGPEELTGPICLLQAAAYGQTVP
ncbi:MAG: hypothetical protein AMXMBFR47_16560 [Planctomycetota bacterium]